MKIQPSLPGTIQARVIVLVGAVVCLGVLQTISGAAPGVHLLLRDVLFVAGLMIVVELGGIALAIFTLLAAGLYLIGLDTWAAWGLTISIFALLTWLDRIVIAAARASLCLRWIVRLALSAAGGFLPVLFSQIESRFADEEFFVLLQGAELAVFCGLFLTATSYLWRKQQATPFASGRLTVWLSLGGFAGALVGLTTWGVIAYQHSFYTYDVPTYPGVTETTPFVCGEVEPDSRQYDGDEVHRRFLSLIAANPRKSVIETGMLALGTGEQHWAELFRDDLLAEAKAARFTGPANSVKSTQHEAALRVYYAPRVRAAFPDVFTDQQWRTLQDWFAAINRRALTVEWVDWMYALAFSKPPEGPYENQENGAGLLAILETEGLGDPALASLNRAYLERNRRGWEQRFHNTDDAYIYQPEWITNAYFQSLYWAKQGNDAPPENRRRAFEWMLLQALPDGAPVCYNHPGCGLFVGAAYLAAQLEGDPRFIWWSGRMLDRAAQNNAALWAYPGVEKALSLNGVSPQVGSCLIYSDSGLPNQQGPLAPDKIVLRDGWGPEAVYLLLNLRFSGWHRYKATNNVVLLYRQGPIIIEDTAYDPFAWLPVGRSLFRDKRIPRENLNGLLIPRTGWSSVTQLLSGTGSEWAQDPPYYARVESVKWLGAVDVARTVMDNWRGWKHVRTVYFVHRGPVIVVDSASGPGQAALAWHVAGEGRQDETGLWLREAPAAVKMVMPAEAWRYTSILSNTTTDTDGVSLIDITYRSPQARQLYLPAMFLYDDWTNLQFETQRLPQGQVIRLIGTGIELTLLQNDSGGWLETPHLATDSRWALWVVQETKQWLCFDGGTRIQTSLAVQPALLLDATGQSWTDWQWQEGALVVRNALPESALCLSVVE